MPPQHHHPSPGDSDLLSELLSHNAYFDSLVNMIPARLYIAGASGDDAYNPKYGKGQHKESKEARRARNKIAKREKFDPSKMETTLETKRRVQMMENAEDDDDSDDDGNDNMDMSDDDGEGDTTADANTRTVHPSASSGNTKNANPNNSSATNTTHETQSYASRIEMLRAKLHAKMTEKRALAAGMSVEEYDANSSKVVDVSSATSSTTTTPPALVSKRAARRAEKRKRQEAAKQRNKKNGYSTVIQGNIQQQQQQQQQQQHRMGGNNSTSFTKSNSPTTTIITASQDLATIDYQSLAGLKPKLDGALNNKSLIGVTGGSGSGSSGLNKKKSLEKLLADAERKQARLRELKASGNEEDKEKARNIEWGETLKVAGGTNLRKTNDPKLLKNALKRKAKKKAASAKAWNVRLDQAKDATAKKQQIRSHNIDARKVGGAVGANLSSKRVMEQDGNNDGDGADAGGGGSGKNNKEKRRRLGPHSGQGQNRAGFEGRKSGFINGGGSKQGGATNGGGAKKG